MRDDIMNKKKEISKNSGAGGGFNFEIVVPEGML
jgi:hypothetical protein